MNDTRRASMKTFEDSYAEPPPYSSQPPSQAASATNIPAGDQQTNRVPAIETLNFDRSPLEIPTPAECIAHLKLLHAFAKLRHDVGNCEGLYGISTEKFSQPANQNGSSSATLDAGLAEQIRDKRWTIFVTKAVERYEKWWDTLPTTYLYSPTVTRGVIATIDFDSTYSSRYLGMSFLGSSLYMSR